MHSFFLTLTCKTTTLDVDAPGIIGSVKTEVQNEKGILPGQQRLIFAGKQFEDATQEGSTPHLVLCWRGGVQTFAKTLLGNTITLVFRRRTSLAKWQ
eukprot:5577412-Karenia_brevis.AAC.1